MKCIVLSWRSCFFIRKSGTPEGRDTSKILYEVSKIDRGKILRFLRILEDSGDSLGIPGDSWGFQGILEDS